MTLRSLPFHRPRFATLVGLVLTLLPVATVLRVHIASAASQVGDVDAAIAAQRERIAREPTSAEAYNDLGNLLALRDDRANAEQAYREALRLDPSSFSAHFNLGVLLRTGHRPDEALEMLERALELEPNSAWAQYQLGAAHQALGHRNRATRAYARAFALDNRLALPDVNPLVIGNPLVTAAMLTRQDVPLADTTPRSYADPVTISQLLLPPPAPEPKAAPANTTGAPGDSPSPPSGDAGASVQPPTTPGSVVRPPANATAPPGSSATSGSAVSGTGVSGTGLSGTVTPGQGDRRITSDDVRSLRVLNQAGQESATPPPPQGGTRDPGSLQAPQRFRPGRRSSAQLDLVPVPQARPAGAGAAFEVTPTRR